MYSSQECTSRLTDWALKALPGIEVAFEAPPLQIDDPCVCLYAFSLEGMMYQHGTTRVRPPTGFRLRYLITTWAESNLEIQEMLAKLFFAAKNEADFDVELTANDPRLWQAFGIPPRPAFFLLVPIIHEREEPDLPRIRQPPRLGSSAAMPFWGRVVGPGNQCVASARVELPSLDKATHTDAEGYFSFHAIPSQPTVRELRVRAGGIVRTVELDTNREQPVCVLFKP